MPLPLRYQWDISNSNCTYEHWLECELMKRLEIEETKILQTNNKQSTPLQTCLVCGKTDTNYIAEGVCRHCRR